MFGWLFRWSVLDVCEWHVCCHQLLANDIGRIQFASLPVPIYPHWGWDTDNVDKNHIKPSSCCIFSMTLGLVFYRILTWIRSWTQWDLASSNYLACRKSCYRLFIFTLIAYWLKTRPCSKSCLCNECFKRWLLSIDDVIMKTNACFTVNTTLKKRVALITMAESRMRWLTLAVSNQSWHAESRRMLYFHLGW